MTDNPTWYRKSFDQQHEAKISAEGFVLMPGIDRAHRVPETRIDEAEGSYWLYVSLYGEVDDDLMQATGFERVS